MRLSGRLDMISNHVDIVEFEDDENVVQFEVEAGSDDAPIPENDI